MGTRADFYIRKDEQMARLGSIAWDGYKVADNILHATTQQEYEKNVDEYLAGRRDGTFPKDGWPWPWNDSRTTDYSYIFENGKVMASVFGYKLFDPLNIPDDENEQTEDDVKMENYFPDMSQIKNVNMGERSGLLFISARS